MRIDVYSKDRPYFVYDPERDGFEYYATEEERDEKAEDIIKLYLQDTWDEGVVNIVAGVVTHTIEQTNRVDRPECLDDEGVDEWGVEWDIDTDYTCDYKLTPMNEIQKLISETEMNTEWKREWYKILERMKSEQGS